MTTDCRGKRKVFFIIIVTLTLVSSFSFSLSATKVSSSRTKLHGSRDFFQSVTNNKRGLESQSGLELGLGLALPATIASIFLSVVLAIPSASHAEAMVPAVVAPTVQIEKEATMSNLRPANAALIAPSGKRKREKKRDETEGEK